jgi:uncharacterized protein (DUF1697 family)
MALVVFLRGVNVGGHRTFRPSALAKSLAEHDVVNVGAAGTFVVRKPKSRAAFRAALTRALPFVTDVAMCDGRAIAELVDDDPFFDQPSHPDVVRFVSIASKSASKARARPKLPIVLPDEGEWLVKVFASRGPFVFGLYRRHMKTIGHLGRLDRLFGGAVTTRNWNTIVSIARVLGAATRQSSKAIITSS